MKSESKYCCVYWVGNFIWVLDQRNTILIEKKKVKLVKPTRFYTGVGGYHFEY